MQYYTERHIHTCGVDLHGRNLYLCVLDPDREIVLHRRVDGDEEKLLRAYVQDLAFYEYMAAEERLFLVNIDEAARFSTEKMLAFLGRTEAGKHSADFVENWRVVNPLKKQQSQQGEEETREERPGLDSLRERHPWINAIEARYHRLWETSV